MKHDKKSTLIFRPDSVGFSGVFAYDFSAPNSQGDTIYYNLNHELNQATVTYKIHRDSSDGQYSGKITIPSEIRPQGIPYKVFTIGDFAFYNCPELTEIKIPASVDTIREKAFMHSGLTELVIPSTVKSVRADAFFYCSKLKEVVIEDSPDPMLFYWGDGYSPAFHKCPVETIYYGRELKCGLIPAFEDIVTLKKLTFGNFVTSLPGFRGCVGLTEVVIPNSVVSVSMDLFAFCSRLTKVVMSNSIVRISNGAFQKCVSLEELKIPDAVRYIGWYAFLGCKNLKELRLPSEVSFIAGRAFMNCTDLRSFVLPDSLRIISGETFKGCSGLTEVLIPSLVDSVGDEAFSQCYYLREMWIMNPIPPKCGEDVFWRLLSRPDLYVPEGSASLYASHPVWGRLGGCINEIPSGVQGIDSDPDVSVIATKEGMRIVGCRDNDLVTIYSIGGQLLYRSVVGDGRIRFSLAKGTPYIVRTAGKSFKVQY